MTVLNIKPVSKTYFKTSKVSLRDIAVKRRAGVAIFATRMNPDGSETDVFLIQEPAKRLKEGSVYKAQHMDTGRKYGEHFVKACISFNIVKGVIQIAGVQPGTAEYSEMFDMEAVAFQMA